VRGDCGALLAEWWLADSTAPAVTAETALSPDPVKYVLMLPSSNVRDRWR
jgi:hypothetical protein